MNVDRVRILRFAAAVMLTWSVGLTCSYGQGIISSPEKLEADAKICMTKFLESWRPDKERIAWIIRGELWGIRKDRERSMDWICGSLRDAKEDFCYEFACQSINTPLGDGVRLWEQLLSCDSAKVHRIGGGGSGGSTLFDNKATKKSAKSDPRDGNEISHIGYADPWAMAIGPLDNVYSGTIQMDWPADVFLANGRFIGGKLSESGNRVGLWQCFGLQGSVVLVEFDSGEDPRPIRVEWRRANGNATIDNFEALVLFCSVRTKWESLEVAGSKKKFPKEVLMAVFNADGLPSEELTAFVRWKFAEEVKVPKWDAGLVRNMEGVIDWRDPVLNTFRENWNLKYKEAKDIMIDESNAK